MGSRTVAPEVAQIIQPSLQKTKKWRINAFLNADYAITDILPDWIFAATLWIIISGMAIPVVKFSKEGYKIRKV